MDEKDFDKLVAKTNDASEIRRGEIDPSRVHRFQTVDIRVPYRRLRLFASCLLRVLLACVLGTLTGALRSVAVFKLSGIELQKVFRNQVEDGMSTFVGYLIMGAVFGFLIGLVYATWYYFKATAKTLIVLNQQP